MDGHEVEQGRAMIYNVLADLTILFHFLWILFLIFGVFFAIKRSKIAWFHLGGLLFSLFINMLGMYCPLTYLENYLRSIYGASGPYLGSFIAHYLERVIYLDLPEKTIRMGEILFVCLNLVVYGVLAKRYFLRSRPGSRGCSLPDAEFPGKGL